MEEGEGRGGQGVQVMSPSFVSVCVCVCARVRERHFKALASIESVCVCCLYGTSPACLRTVEDFKPQGEARVSTPGFMCVRVVRSVSWGPGVSWPP